MKIKSDTPHILSTMIAVAGLAFAIPLAIAQPDRSHLAPLSLDQLQEAYLECDLLATHTILDAATAGACSLVAQELLERGFDGDIDQLLTWWRSARKEMLQPVEPDEEAAGVL